MYTEAITNILSFVGIAAFSASGAMVAIERNTDLFGVVVLSATTATGGGIIRDILLGRIPPLIFLHPAYFFIAASVALVLFIFAHLNYDGYCKKSGFIDKTNNIFDALGLGIFASLGTQTAIESGFGSNMFLSVMIGTLTGVGGGFLRDIMVLKIPVILIKHIYALAALSGSIVFFILHLLSISYGITLVLSTLVTFSLRLMATHYKWNLPRASSESEE